MLADVDKICAVARNVPSNDAKIASIRQKVKAPSGQLFHRVNAAVFK